MSKYDPLKDFLEGKGLSHIPMTFSQIESIINAQLPPSARKHRAWWSNNPSNSVITYAWLGAGYRSAEVNLEGEKVVFFKTGGASSTLSKTTQEMPTGPHPVFGCMTGTVTIPGGSDLTEPAMPEWGNMADTIRLQDG